MAYTEQMLQMADPLMFELNSGSYDPKSGNLLSWAYYDRLIISAATEYQFFREGPGGAAAKTLADTNFNGGGQIGSNEAIRIEELNLYYTPDDPMSQANNQILIEALSDSFFTFNLQNKPDSIQMPLDLWMGDPLPQIVTGGAVGDQLTTRTRKIACKRLDVPIILQAKTNFFAIIKFDAAPNAAIISDKLMIEMWGRKISL